jgi:hypothetical protein
VADYASHRVRRGGRVHDVRVALHILVTLSRWRTPFLRWHGTAICDHTTRRNAQRERLCGFDTTLRAAGIGSSLYVQH